MNVYHLTWRLPEPCLWEGMMFSATLMPVFGFFLFLMVYFMMPFYRRGDFKVRIPLSVFLPWGLSDRFLWNITTETGLLCGRMRAARHVRSSMSSFEPQNSLFPLLLVAYGRDLSSEVFFLCLLLKFIFLSLVPPHVSGILLWLPGARPVITSFLLVGLVLVSGKSLIIT